MLPENSKYDAKHTRRIIIFYSNTTMDFQVCYEKAIILRWAFSLHVEILNFYMMNMNEEGYLIMVSSFFDKEIRWENATTKNDPFLHLLGFAKAVFRFKIFCRCLGIAKDFPTGLDPRNLKDRKNNFLIMVLNWIQE